MGRKIEFEFVSREPTYKEIRRKRLAHGLTQVAAAGLIYLKVRMWEYFEANEYRMARWQWELFVNKCTLLFPISHKKK